MRVIEVVNYGGPDVLQLADRPDPVPADGKVRVRVAATVVNPTDLVTRTGALAERTPNATLPIVLGWDFTGELLDPTPGLSVGQPVAGMYPWFTLGDGSGTYADTVLVEPSSLAPLPDGADPVEAATIAMNGQTAQQALRIAAPRAGQTVLITGASGSVGGFAVQLAVEGGARVIAVSSRGDEDYVRSLGAPEVINRDDLVGTVRAAHPDGVDAVIDAGSAGGNLISVVRDGGRYVSATDQTMPAAERGIHVETVHTQPDGSGLRELLDRWAAGRLSTRVVDVMPLADAARAHRRLEAGGLLGKIVLTP